MSTSLLHVDLRLSLVCFSARSQSETGPLDVVLQEEEKESQKSSFRKRRRHMLDESDERAGCCHIGSGALGPLLRYRIEYCHRSYDAGDWQTLEEAAPATPVKSKNQYKMALAESDSEEEAGVNKEKGEKGEKAKREEEEEEEEEEDSGDESDDSHASQHTNASDPVRPLFPPPLLPLSSPLFPTLPHLSLVSRIFGWMACCGARSPSRRAQDKTAKKGGDTEMDDLDDMPDGKLVITKKGGGAK
eukprot:2185348-Rhodomonas_salina.2